MKKHDSAGLVVTLKISGKGGDGTYEAIPAFNDTETTSVVIGDVGFSASPRHLYEPMAVSVDSANTSLVLSIQQTVEARGLKITPPDRMTSDTAKVEIRETQDGEEKFVVSTPFRSKEGVAEAAAVTPVVTGILISDAQSYYWATLINPFQTPNATRIVHSRPDPHAIVGEPIDLYITSSLSGYLCVLEPESDGVTRVLFPNERSNPRFWSQALAHNDLRQIAKIRAVADKPGPTFFVVLVSTAKRPLSSFLLSPLRGKLETWNGNPIGDDEIGPGWLHEDIQNRPASVEWTPESWDAGRVVVDVGTVPR